MDPSKVEGLGSKMDTSLLFLLLLQMLLFRNVKVVFGMSLQEKMLVFHLLSFPAQIESKGGRRREERYQHHVGGRTYLTLRIVAARDSECDL